MNYPDTITNPEAFARSTPAGFDGTFDWSWMRGCFGGTKIMPMDIDAVVERRGRLLVFESKDRSTIPRAQWWTLTAIHSLGGVTVMAIKGKHLPERGRIWWEGAPMTPTSGTAWVGVESARALVEQWFRLVNGND